MHSLVKKSDKPRAWEEKYSSLLYSNLLVDSSSFQWNFLWSGKISASTVSPVSIFVFFTFSDGFRIAAGRSIESKSFASFEDVGCQNAHRDRGKWQAVCCLVLLILHSATATNAGFMYKHMRTELLLRWISIRQHHRSLRINHGKVWIADFWALQPLTWKNHMFRVFKEEVQKNYRPRLQWRTFKKISRLSLDIEYMPKGS